MQAPIHAHAPCIYSHSSGVYACQHPSMRMRHAIAHSNGVHVHAPCMYLTLTRLRQCTLVGWNFCEWQGHEVHYITAGTQVRTNRA
jgi:hypothetical protein